MFYTLLMQIAFDLGQSETFISVRNRLRRLYGVAGHDFLRDPVSQLIKSMLSTHTYDRVSTGALERLQGRYRDWDALAKAPAADIALLIGDVTYADRKAAEIGIALRQLKARSGDLCLDFLHDWTTADALAYLENMQGVGRKISAAVLNFSTLREPALVIDSHLLRVLAQLGLIGPRVDNALTAYQVVMPMLTAWTAGELFELHCLLKRLGQDICRPVQPRCCTCPLETLCRQSGQP
jgi:endonuclease-3